MTVQEVVTLCKKGLTGEVQTDIAYIEQEMHKYTQEENADQLLNALNDLAFSILPKEQQEQFLETTCINGARLDLVYRDAIKLVNEKKNEEAVVPLRAIAKKAKQYFGADAKERYFSFRNPFEYHIYLQLYGADQKFDRAPFDFSNYLMTLGYVLVELHRMDEAVDALEEAVSYNPVNCDVRFELAEVFKLTQQPSKLLSVTKDTLQFVPSTYALARAYANLGYYCVEIRDFDSAVCFFYESLVYNNHPGVHGELQHLEGLVHHKIEPPTREQVLAVFKKYDIPNGPSGELIALAVTLAGQAIQMNKKELGYYFYTIAFDLTRDPDIRTRLEHLKKEIEAEHGTVPEQK